MTNRKSTWHADRREKVGKYSLLPPNNPVIVRLREAGLGYIGGVSIGVIDSDFEVYYPEEYEPASFGGSHE